MIGIRLKKYLAIPILVLSAILSTTQAVSYADGEQEAVKVYMTVTDITDVDNPHNVIADRIEVNVPYIDLEEQDELLFNPSGLLVDGSLAGQHKFTALHAIVALHKMVYGDNITTKLYVDENGDITLFFGKTAGAILYQNNEYVFQKPQNMEIGYLDEINICLYNYGHLQQTAIFRDLYTIVQRNENATIHLEEYKEYPEDNIPIVGSKLTDEEGVYLTDTKGQIAKTDEDGAATFSFATGGVKRISIEPEIEYYLDTESSSGNGTIEIVTNAENPKRTIFPIPTYDDPRPMIKYTRPWANIYVDDKFWLDAELAINKQDGYSTIYVNYRNSDTAKVDGALPRIRVGRYTKGGEFLGWVGDRCYTYHDAVGDTFQVEGNRVICNIVNYRAGSQVTCLVYSASAEDITDSTVSYVNQFSQAESGTLTFEFPHRQTLPEGDYIIMINNGNNVGTMTKIHIFTEPASDENMTFIVPETIAEYTGAVAFQYTSYIEDVDDDPSNDTVYKVFVWDWQKSDWEPMYPPVVLEPVTSQVAKGGGK